MPPCTGEGAAPAEPSGADEGWCEQRISGTVTLPFLEVQLADGALVVYEEIGCAHDPYVGTRAFAGVLVLVAAR